MPMQQRIQRPGKGRGAEKHEIYAGAFGGHLFMTYFLRAGYIFVFNIILIFVSIFRVS